MYALCHRPLHQNNQQKDLQSRFNPHQHPPEPSAKDVLPFKSTCGYYHSAISGHLSDSCVLNNLVIEILKFKGLDTAATVAIDRRMKRLCEDMVLKQSGGEQAARFVMP